MARIIICPECNREKKHHARGLCNSCYTNTKWSAKVVVCTECGKKRKHHGHGMCKSCYDKQARANSKDDWGWYDHEPRIRDTHKAVLHALEGGPKTLLELREAAGVTATWVVENILAALEHHGHLFWQDGDTVGVWQAPEFINVNVWEEPSSPDAITAVRL